VTNTILSDALPSNLTLAKIPKRPPLPWAGHACLFDDASRAREVISSTGFQETIFLAEEAIFCKRRRWPEMIVGQHLRGVQTAEFGHVRSLQPDLPGILHRSPG